MKQNPKPPRVSNFSFVDFFMLWVWWNKLEVVLGGFAVVVRVERSAEGECDIDFVRLSCGGGGGVWPRKRDGLGSPRRWRIKHQRFNLSSRFLIILISLLCRFFGTGFGSCWIWFLGFLVLVNAILGVFGMLFLVYVWGCNYMFDFWF